MFALQEGIELMEMNEEQVEQLVNMNMNMNMNVNMNMNMGDGDNTHLCCSSCEYDVFCVVSYLVQKKEDYDQQVNRRKYLLPQPRTSLQLSRLYSVEYRYSSGMESSCSYSHSALPYISLQIVLPSPILSSSMHSLLWQFAEYCSHTLCHWRLLSQFLHTLLQLAPPTSSSSSLLSTIINTIKSRNGKLSPSVISLIESHGNYDHFMTVNNH